jgi:hypothetical protein
VIPSLEEIRLEAKQEEREACRKIAQDVFDAYDKQVNQENPDTLHCVGRYRLAFAMAARCGAKEVLNAIELRGFHVTGGKP